MPATKNTSSPQPWASLHYPGFHSGIVPVTGSATVDLGIGHNNFVPILDQQASTAADANKSPGLTWAYGSKLGTFVIFCWKATSTANPTLIAATAPVNISFTVTADSSVG